MTHEEKMGKTWRFITESGISEERPADYRVANIYEVRDAYYSDLETGAGSEDESLEDFFARHQIVYWERVKPDYCTQNDGDCKTCSLVNYGRDCMNNPIN